MKVFKNEDIDWGEVCKNTYANLSDVSNRNLRKIESPLDRIFRETN